MPRMLHDALRSDFEFSAPAAGQSMFRVTLDFYFLIGRTMARSLCDTLWGFFGAYGGATYVSRDFRFLAGRAMAPARFVTRCANFSAPAAG